MMNMWICAMLLIAAYCTIAGACGGSTTTVNDRACKTSLAYYEKETYISCYWGWWGRICTTQYRLVTKSRIQYSCSQGYKEVKLMFSVYCKSTCGISKYANAGSNYISPNIVGGKDARKNEFPWQVSLLIYAPTIQASICGGTILNTTTILTAAHCVSFSGADNLMVRAGMHDQDLPEHTRQDRFVKSILIHPNYRPANHPNDVALVTLSQPLIFNVDVSAACLPAWTFSVIDKDVVISGWGDVSSAGARSSILKYTVVRVVPWSTHCDIPIFSWEFGTLCVSDVRGRDRSGDRSACIGDSGGPMVIKSGGKWFVVGVSSYGTSHCGAGNPFVYSNVMYHDDFIRYGNVPQSAPPRPPKQRDDLLK